MNRLKNRYTAPTDAQINPAVTLAAMLAPRREYKSLEDQLWGRNQLIRRRRETGRVESVNCHAHDLPHRDTHIELVLDPMHSHLAEFDPKTRSAFIGTNLAEER